MDEALRDELRRLAHWLARRREVDEAVAGLTAYGPAAADQVHSHLDALRGLLAAEHEAWTAVEDAAPQVPQAPLPPHLRPEHRTSDHLASARPDATVHWLRERSSSV